MTAASDLDPRKWMLAATKASRARLIAAGVNGRFRAEGLALTPGLVPDTTPTAPNAKSAANPAINAVAVTRPEDVA